MGAHRLPCVAFSTISTRAISLEIMLLISAEIAKEHSQRGEPLAKGRCPMSQPFPGSTHLRLDLWHVKTTPMRAFDLREQIPDAFLRKSRPANAPTHDVNTVLLFFVVCLHLQAFLQRWIGFRSGRCFRRRRSSMPRYGHLPVFSWVVSRFVRISFWTRIVPLLSRQVFPPFWHMSRSRFRPCLPRRGLVRNMTRSGASEGTHPSALCVCRRTACQRMRVFARSPSLFTSAWGATPVGTTAIWREHTTMEMMQVRSCRRCGECFYASQKTHIHAHRSWIRSAQQAALHRSIRHGSNLWERREELFPHMHFCERVEKQLQAVLAGSPMIILSAGNDRCGNNGASLVER